MPCLHIPQLLLGLRDATTTAVAPGDRVHLLMLSATPRLDERVAVLKSRLGSELNQFLPPGRWALARIILPDRWTC